MKITTTNRTGEWTDRRLWRPESRVRRALARVFGRRRRLGFRVPTAKDDVRLPAGGHFVIPAGFEAVVRTLDMTGGTINRQSE